MASRYHDGLIHGHCRICDASVVAAEGANGWPWSNEWGDECECASVTCPRCAGACAQTCEACVGTGSECEVCGGAGRTTCGRCTGFGWVHGPHWPWRFPPSA